MHIVLIRFHMFFDDILLGRCSGISSGITFAYISNKYLWHLAWLQIHYMTEKINFPPFPSLSSSAQRRVQVTFWQAGHKGMYDILITVYELSLETRSQVQSILLQFCVFVTILFKGYWMPMFTIFARQNKYWQWLKYIRYLYVTCSELQNLSNRTQGGRDT